MVTTNNQGNNDYSNSITMDIMLSNCSDNNQQREGHIAMRDPMQPVTLGPIYDSNGVIYDSS